MAARKAKPKVTPARSRSGPSIPEAQREAKVMSVRLSPRHRAALEALADKWGLSVSATVARLVDEAQREG